MALVASTLTQALERMFRNPQADPARAASQLATAYRDYAQTAQAGASLPVFLHTETLGAKAVFLAITASPLMGNPQTFARSWLAAINAFWLASPAPVQFAGAGAGPITPSLAGEALVSALTTAASGFKPASLAASLIASAVDAYTHTFLVFLTPPGAGVPLV